MTGPPGWPATAAERALDAATAAFPGHALAGRERPVTETPAREGCTCPPRAGFGQERVHDTSNKRCALYRLNVVGDPPQTQAEAPGAPPVNPVDELGQVRLLLQSAGVGAGRTASEGVRQLVAQRDRLAQGPGADVVRALEQIAERGCENYRNDGIARRLGGECWQAGRTADAQYGADRCCAPCVAWRGMFGPSTPVTDELERMEARNRAVIRAENAAVSRAQVGPHPRPFVLVRTDDETGVSGTGVVAQGVQFSDGKAVTRWVDSKVGAVQSCVWDSIEDVVTVHGHGGKTRVVWT